MSDLSGSVRPLGRSSRLLSRVASPAMVPFLMGAFILSLIPDLLGAQEADAGHHAPAVTILWIAVLLLAARLSSLIERIGQPAVLGELLAGVVLGNLALIGITVFEPITADPILLFLAELGVIILLFQIGLESNLSQLGKVGARAMAVAVVGVVLPFVAGTWLVGPLLLPGLDFNAYLFIGAALTATSVGITARVFKDLGTLRTPEAQIVLGAAVIDDVLGLIILAVVSAIVTAGSVSAMVVGWIFLKALLFLAGSIVIGQLMAPRLGSFLSRIHAGAGMKFTLAVAFALVFAWAAGALGLAPIVGAFAAGLVLDPVHFEDFEEAPMLTDVRESVEGADPATRERVHEVLHVHSHRHVEQLIESLGHFLVPIFFVLTGMSVALETLFDMPVLLVALGITIVAVVGKIAAGLVAGSVRRSVVGWGMVPRGEVGLIFATMGRQLGVLPEAEFSVIVIMVILTTLMTPPILSHLLRGERATVGGRLEEARS